MANISIRTDKKKWQGSAGADTITISADRTRGDARQGRDIITLSGDRNSVNGGSGSDSIEIKKGRNNHVDTGVGLDTVICWSYGNTIMGEAGGQRIELYSGSNTVKTGTGNDLMIVHRSGTNELWGGGDDDRFFLGSAAGGNTIHGGTGKDTVALYVDDESTGGASMDNVMADYNSSNDIIQLYNVTSAGTDKVIDFSDRDALNNAFHADGVISAELGYAYAAGSGDSYATAKRTIRLEPNGLSGYYRAVIQQWGAKENGPEAASARKLDQHRVSWVGSSGVTMNNSGQSSSLIMLGTTNDEGDSLVGGKGKDTVFAGNGDSVYGGKGNDSILLTGAANACVELRSANSGADEVVGFDGGFGDAADIVYLRDGLASASAKITSDGTGVDIAQGTGKLHLRDIAGADLGSTSDMKGILVADGANLKRVAAVREKAVGMVTDGEVADYYLGVGSSLDASGLGENVAVDLDNRNRYGSTAYYDGIVAVKGSDHGDNILIGAAGERNTLSGGAGVGNSLYGGGASHDLLRGGSGGEDMFFFGIGDGKDTVDGYVSGEDALYLLSGAVTGVRRDSEAIEVSFALANGEAGDADKLFLRTTGSVDDAIGYTTDGVNIRYAKAGLADTANTFTYDGDVAAYYGGTKGDTLNVTGAEDAKIYLGGLAEDANAPLYVGVHAIDATESVGNLELAGDNHANMIHGGKGDTSLWGGSGDTADTLVGGAGMNTFFFGKGEGKDIISSSGNADKVMLYNVGRDDVNFGATGVDGSGNLVISLRDGSRLTLEGYGNQGAGTIQLTDAVYTYNRETASWSVR